MAKSTEITNSLRILFELALTILNNEDRIKTNIVKVLTNNMLRFISPVLFATIKTAISPTIPNINEARNHFKNLLILPTPLVVYIYYLIQRNRKKNFFFNLTAALVQ